jgi:hypothetical protein
VRAPILPTGFVSVSLAVAPSVGDTLAGEGASSFATPTGRR